MSGPYPLPRHPDLMEDEEPASWVDHLVSDQVEEGLLLDYKAMPYDLAKDGDKRELAKDVASFANTQGGAILLGVPEDDRKPKAPYGTMAQSDYESRVTDILSATVLPFLPQLRIRWVPTSGGAGDGVYVIWHPESWGAPHMVSAYNEFRYPRRAADRSLPVSMKEDEVRRLYERRLQGEEHTKEFLDRTDHFYHGHRAVRRAYLVIVLCPRMLPEGAFNFSDKSSRDWVLKHGLDFGDLADRVFRSWSPTSVGARQLIQARGLPECVALLHSTGAVSLAVRLSESQTGTDKGVGIAYESIIRFVHAVYHLTGELYDHLGRSFVELVARVVLEDVMGCWLTINNDKQGDKADVPTHILDERLVAAELIADADKAVRPMLTRIWQTFAHTWEPPL